jgi:ribosomal protein S17E
MTQMDEHERAEQKLKSALQDFEQAIEAVRKLTRQDVDATINRVLGYARTARRHLLNVSIEFIEAHKWRLGR